RFGLAALEREAQKQLHRAGEGVGQTRWWGKGGWMSRRGGGRSNTASQVLRPSLASQLPQVQRRA
ncbi:hypothetical protein G3435_26470, partial [Pseudomonas sp. MAFF212428]|nr:hypothetical protein [Pseudomonas brassicae]